MNPLIQLGVIAGVLLLVVVIVAVAARIGTARDEAKVQEIADRHDLDVHIGDVEPPDVGLMFFRNPNRQRVSYSFRPKDEDALVCKSILHVREMHSHRHDGSLASSAHDLERQKTRESGARTVVLLPLPFDAPHTVISRTSDDRNQLHDSRDIPTPTGLPTCDDKYQVASRDPEFVNALFDSEFGQFLGDRIVPYDADFELAGPWLLCIRNDQPVDQSFAILRWAHRFRDSMSPELAERYPLSSSSG